MNPPPPQLSYPNRTSRALGGCPCLVNNYSTPTHSPSNFSAIKRRIQETKHEDIPMDVAQKAWNIVKNIDIVNVIQVSLGAGTFLVWTQTMCSYRLGV